MVDERIQALINAELDGEIDAETRAELERALAGSSEARKLRDDLGQIVQALGGMKQEPAPEGLREAIINAVRNGVRANGKVVPFEAAPFAAKRSQRREFKRFGFALAAGFALGAIGLVAWQAIRVASESPEGALAGIRGIDAAEMAGTMVRGSSADEVEAASARIDSPEVRGTATLFEGNGVLVLQLDLDSQAPVSVNASYDSAGLRLMGFAQGSVADASIRSAPGTVGYVNQGEQRFVVYLARSKAEGGAIQLSFQVGGLVVREVTVAVPAK